MSRWTVAQILNLVVPPYDLVVPPYNLVVPPYNLVVPLTWSFMTWSFLPMTWSFLPPTWSSLISSHLASWGRFPHRCAQGRRAPTFAWTIPLELLTLL